MNDYNYFENKASLLALKAFEIKLLEASLDGDIIPDNVLEMIDAEIKLYEKRNKI